LREKGRGPFAFKREIADLNAESKNGAPRFDDLVKPWRADLFRFVFWLCHDADLADDIVQETMLRAFRALGSLRDPCAVKLWLLTIARREHARALRRRPSRDLDIDELSRADTALIATPEADTDVMDMRRGIMRLPRKYREPLLLQVLFEFTTHEIAVALGIHQGAVLTRLHRARLQLMRLVRPELVEIEGANQACTVRNSDAAPEPRPATSIPLQRHTRRTASPARHTSSG
jgi:RNA polymerase sigma-70 factor, ECF subfamily